MGVLVWWGTIMLRKPLLALGLRQGTWFDLPWLGLAAGRALGGWIGVTRWAARAAKTVMGWAMLVGFLWFAGVLAGGLLVGMGVSAETADRVPVWMAWLGVGLGVFATGVAGMERVGKK